MLFLLHHAAITAGEGGGGIPSQCTLHADTIDTRPDTVGTTHCGAFIVPQTVGKICAMVVIVIAACKDAVVED